MGGSRLRQPLHHLPPSPHLSCITLLELPQSLITCRVPGQPALGENRVLGGGCLKPGWAAGRDLLGHLGGIPSVLKRSSLCKPETQEREDQKGACTVPSRACHHGEGQQNKAKGGQGAQSWHWVMRVSSLPQVMWVMCLSCWHLLPPAGGLASSQ